MPSTRTTHPFCRRSLLPAALIALTAISVHAQKPFAMVDKWVIGGEGGWDYLLADSTAHRLYITHGPHVEVVDTHTGKSIGAITGLKGTHGVRLYLRRRSQRRDCLRPVFARHRGYHPHRPKSRRHRL